MAKYTLMKTEGRAKRAQFETVHGTIQTPVFMNVGTIGAIKGAVSTQDLYEIGTQVELSNTYHLHVRPGDKIVKQLGGLHKFMNWERPILTDSGGFRCFRLQSFARSKKKVYISSHILTDIRSLWDRKKACRSSLIWDPQSRWHSMNVRAAWQREIMYRNL